MNSCNFIGRAVRDPETKYTSTNMAVTTITLAVNKGRDKAAFLSFKAFKETAETIAKHVSKGQQIGVTARADVEEGEKDGKKNSKVVFIIDRFDFAGERKGEHELARPTSENASTGQSEGFYTLSEDDSELPF